MSVRIDTSEVEKGAMSLQDFQRTYYRAVTGGFTQAARLYIVPQIRNRLVPTRYKKNVHASTTNWKRDGFRVKFTLRGGGKYAKPIVGMFNFGGYLPRPIFPNRKKALLTPDGPRAVVKNRAKIAGGPNAGMRFFEGGIRAGRSSFLNQIGKILVKRLEQAFK